MKDKSTFFSRMFGKNQPSAEALLRQGEARHAAGDQEGAYALYTQAADLGSTAAMVAIGNMYLLEKFRQVEKSNLPQLLAQGMPVMPWALKTEQVPDHAAALQWYRRAADAGSGRGCYCAAILLCEGLGGPRDLQKGVAYLQQAVILGEPRTADQLKRYTQAPEDVPAEAYESLLATFREALGQRSDAAAALYQRLSHATPALTARLNYVLLAARHASVPGAEDFPLCTEEGMPPLLPACVRRANWESFLRVDLNALPSPDTLLTFASDLGCTGVLTGSHRLRRVGTAVYESPGFCWLNEKKRPPSTGWTPPMCSPPKSCSRRPHSSA